MKHNSVEIETIAPIEFIEYERQHSKSAHGEWVYSLRPEFSKYQIRLFDFLSNDVYPTYRLDESGEKLTTMWQDKKATPITFSELAVRQDLVKSLLRNGYRSKNDTVIAYHCSGCGIWVIKDGVHRLTTWLVNGENRMITVYQVSSRDWSRAWVDMPNFCKCSEENPSRTVTFTV